MVKIIRLEKRHDLHLRIYFRNKKIFSWRKKHKTSYTLKQVSKYLERYLYVLDRKLDSPSKKIENDIKVWQVWLQGIDNAPEVVKLCNKSQQKYIKESMLLTEESFRDYIDVPDFIYNKWKAGIINHAAFSDYIRLQLLYNYGGLYLDSTIYLTDIIPEYILNSNFFCFSHTPIILGGDEYSISNTSLLYAKTAGNPLIGYLIKLHDEYWENEDSAIDYCIIHAFFSLAVKNNKLCKNIWDEMPFYSDVNFHVLQMELYKPFTEYRMKQIKEISSLHKLSRINGFDPEKYKGTNFEYLFNMCK